MVDSSNCKKNNNPKTQHPPTHILATAMNADEQQKKKNTFWSYLWGTSGKWLYLLQKRKENINLS